MIKPRSAILCLTFLLLVFQIAESWAQHSPAPPPKVPGQPLRKGTQPGALVAAARGPSITVQSPKTGDSFPLDGNVIQTAFTVSNFDLHQNLQIKEIEELLHNGTVLGVTGSPNVSMYMDINRSTQAIGAQTGQYFSGKNYQEKTAAPGGGYQYRITAYTGNWLSSPKILARALSGTFTFEAPAHLFKNTQSDALAAAKRGPASIAVQSPKTGDSFPLDGNVIQTAFTVSNFDLSQNWQIKVMEELLHNGTVLGVTGSPNAEMYIDLTRSSQAISAYSGKYCSGKNCQGKTAAPGGGYQYRITAYTGEWLSSPKILARALSGTFSFGPKTGITVPMRTRKMLSTH